MTRKVVRGTYTVRWKSKDGKPGDDAVTYDIVPSVSTIHADGEGQVSSDGIIVRAYRTVGTVRSDNILPEDDYPEQGDYYYAEYKIDGGLWTQCGKIAYPTGPSDDIEWLDKYGVGYQVVNTVKESIAFRLKHSSNTNVVLKEIPPIKVVKDGDDAVTYDIVPSVSVINASSTGVVRTGAIELKAYRTVGSERSSNLVGIAIAMGVENPAYYYVEYKVDSGEWTSCGNITILETSSHSVVQRMGYGVSGSVVATATVGIEFRLKHSSAPTVILKQIPQIKVVKDGAPGGPGPQGIDGCIRRIREWKVGEEYRNDKALNTSELRYIDIAVKKQNGKVVLACICLQTHTATAELEPQDQQYTTVNNTRYWEKINNLGAIYTPFIWADDAVFQFAQTNQLVVLKTDSETVNVALGGGTWPFWVGATAAGLNGSTPLAPFQIKDNGEFWATNAHITGEIISNSGRIGGFSISSNSLNSYSDGLLSGNNHNGTVDSMYLSSSKLVFDRSVYNNSYASSSTESFFAVGSSGVVPQSASGTVFGCARIESNKTLTFGDLFGLWLSVEGTSAYDSSVMTGSHAIVLEKGHYLGFRKRLRRVSSNQTLSKYDSNIICINNDITLTMPADCEDGQEFFIRSYGRYVTLNSTDGSQFESTVTSSNGQPARELTTSFTFPKAMFSHTSESSWITTSRTLYIMAVLVIYEKTNNRWIVNYLI